MAMDDRQLADARREVTAKHRKQIEEETAHKWAARAIVTYLLYKESGDNRWLTDSADYYHEAIEHAALADHSGGVLLQVREWVHQYIPHGAL